MIILSIPLITRRAESLSLRMLSAIGGLNFNLGSAVKYVARAGRKDDIVQDLRKAQEFIQFEIDALELERATQKPSEEPKEPIHPNCRCSLKVAPPNMTIQLVVPVGTPRDQLIQLFIQKLYGVN